MTFDLKEIAPALHDGERDAWNIVTVQLGPALYHYLYHRCGDEHLAADLLGETWLAAYRRRETIDPERLVASWFYAIASHKFDESGRRKKLSMAGAALHEEHSESDADAPVSLIERLPDPNPTPDDRAATQEQLELLMQAVESLPAGERAVIVLLMQRLSLSEIAKELDRPYDTVYGQYRRALIGIREFLDRKNSKGLEPDR